MQSMVIWTLRTKAMPEHIQKLIDRMIALVERLDNEGRYTDADIVWLALQDINDRYNKASS
jgi:hypothetical protein